MFALLGKNDEGVSCLIKMVAHDVIQNQQDPKTVRMSKLLDASVNVFRVEPMILETVDI